MDDREALEVLGLRGPADATAVKQAYRRLARRLHPDAGGDPDEFLRVRTAYEVVGGGTTVTTGPPPQQRVAGVDDRWWDTAGAWHDRPVDVAGVDLTRTLPDARAVRVDLDLLASLLHGPAPIAPVRLRSRAPGSWLHRIIAWLQPDLLGEVMVTPAADGPRAGHDVEVVVRSAAGRGRRLLAAADTPGGWTRARGSETVWLQRRFRPCHDRAETAVRIAREVHDVLEQLGWPLGEWFILRP